MIESLAQKQSWFETIYDEYGRQFWYYLLKTVRDEALADDIFQEAMYKMWRVRPKGLHPAQEKAYLFQIGTRLVIDHKRKEKRGWNFMERFQREETQEEKIDEGLSEEFFKPFKKLSVRDRSLLWLAYVEDYSHKDIAVIMSVKEESVKVMLYRAKRKLEKLLENAEIINIKDKKE